jgi:UDP-N-acetylglucosamine--N-acetylmuramyl-(pentapeptide) pyrophosphoryl-undecaprenol N-acetylglucosamine transferase
MTWGFFQSLSLLNRIRPDALIAAGGFVSTPLLLAARAKKTKFFLLEQNRIPGRVVRAFSRYAAKTFLTFPVQGQLPGPTLVTGTPLRKQLVKRAMKIPAPLVHVFQCQVPSSPNQEPGTMNQEPSTSASPTVLVLGGSQGARALNLAALDMAAVLTNLRFIILTGRRDYPEIKSLIRSSNCEIIDWTDHPEELYEQATLAVTRGGGLVLSELLLFGIPAIIIPFPFAADRHQYANALYLSEQGAAVLLEQSQLSGLVSLVRSLIADQRKLKEMRKKARSLAQPDATQKICSTILQELSLFPVSSSKSQEL